MHEHGQTASHNEKQDDPSTRPKQLRNREVSWEGSHRSKLMSRRTERPYKVDGTGELAQHSEARCSIPEINGPVVQQEFTSLLREACNPSPSATAGAAARDGCGAGAGVSRGHSTGRYEPGALIARLNQATGRTHTREGLNLAGRHDHRWSCSGSNDADWLSYRQRSSWQRKSGCVIPQGLPGTAVRGPACTVVWEPGGAILPATRLALFISKMCPLTTEPSHRSTCLGRREREMT